MRASSVASLLLLAGAAAALPGACSSDGELVVVITSEIRIDGIAYEILRDGVLIERRCALLSETTSGGLPGSISVVGEAGTPVTIRLIGLVGSTCDESAGFDPDVLGSLAVLREIVTTIPDGRSATLSVVFAKSCRRDTGVIVADGAGEFDDGECAAGTTCIDASDGACVDSTVDSSALPDYSAGDLGGGGSGFLGGGGAGAGNQGGNGGAGAGGNGGSGGEGGGGGGPTVCQSEVLYDQDVIRVASAAPDVIYVARTGLDEGVWRRAGQDEDLVPYGGVIDDVIALAAATDGQDELVVIANSGTSNLEHVVFNGTTFGAFSQAGSQVSDAAAISLPAGLAPLWTEGILANTASHWHAPGQPAPGPLGASLGQGFSIAAAGDLAAFSFLDPNGTDQKLDVVALSSCSPTCSAPVYTRVATINSLTVGKNGDFGLVAWIDGVDESLWVYSTESDSAMSLGGDHVLVAADDSGHTSVVDQTNTLRIRTGGFNTTEDCLLQLSDTPSELVQSGGAAYARLIDGSLVRVSPP